MTQGEVYTAIWMDGVEVLGLRRSEGRLVLNAEIRNADNRTILSVRESELMLSTQEWDVTFVGTTITIRNAPGAILLRLRFVPPESVYVERAEFWMNGIALIIDAKRGLWCPNTNNGFRDLTIDAPAGFSIGVPEREGAFKFGPIRRRFLGGLPSKYPNSFTVTT